MINPSELNLSTLPCLPLDDRSAFPKVTNMEFKAVKQIAIDKGWELKEVKGIFFGYLYKIYYSPLDKRYFCRDLKDVLSRLEQNAIYPSCDLMPSGTPQPVLYLPE